MLFGSASERFVDGTKDPQGTCWRVKYWMELAPQLPPKTGVAGSSNAAANNSRPTAACLRTCRASRTCTAPRPRPRTTTPQGQPCGCAECGGRLREIGRDVSEQLEYVPGHFKVCATCGPSWPAWLPARVPGRAPSRPDRPRSAGPALMAHVMVSKYCDHQPLYRQSGIYAARDGVELDRSTLAGWVDKGDELIDPLVAAVRRYVLANDKIHGDDTPVKVLARAPARPAPAGCGCTCATTGLPATPLPGRRGSPTRRPRRRTSPGAPARLQGRAAGRCLQRLARLYATGDVQEVACWAHARGPGGSCSRAAAAIRTAWPRRRCSASGRSTIEDDIRGQPPDVRKAQRQARAGPLLEQMRLAGNCSRVSAKSDIAQAIGYSLVRWKALTRYVDDGRWRSTTTPPSARCAG
jgi:transposase